MNISSHPSIQYVKSNSKAFFLFLCVISGIFFLWPYMDFQPYLSQGDHGRDLYAFELAMHETPYKDYWWVYGPLMPSYYNLFVKWLGVNIASILIAENFLILLSGILIFLCMSELVPLTLAFATACWFWVFQADFFFTYNHTGGVTASILVFYALLLYIKNQNIKFLYLGIAGSFILNLIKINFGLAALAGLFFCWGIHEISHSKLWTKQNRLALGTAVLSVVVTIFIYKFLVSGLSISEIRQCLPYLSGDQPYETSAWSSITLLSQVIWLNIKSSSTNIIFAIILNLAFLHCAYRFLTERPWALTLRTWAGLALILFMVLNFHEFLKSGVLYRSFWAKPFQVMLMFLAVSFSLEKLPKGFRYLVYTGIFALMLSQSIDQTRLINQAKIPSQYLSHPKTKIFVQNSPAWINTINQTTDYLLSHLQPQEKFFALPYDALYYYLTDRESPTRQLIFFEHIKIPVEQEEKIVKELDDQKINYVLVSSRASAREPGLGILGETYCPVIGRWLTNNFEVVATFGDWKNEPGWAWNHGTKILKRRNIQ